MNMDANVNSPLRGVRERGVWELGEQTSKAKLRITFSADELAQLRRAVSESMFPNMALFIFQAIHVGLEDDQLALGAEKRTKSVTMHVSKEFKQKIRARARMNHVSQQTLLHHLVFQYIRNRPWLREEKREAT